MTGSAKKGSGPRVTNVKTPYIHRGSSPARYKEEVSQEEASGKDPEGRAVEVATKRVLEREGPFALYAFDQGWVFPIKALIFPGASDDTYCIKFFVSLQPIDICERQKITEELFKMSVEDLIPLRQKIPALRYDIDKILKPPSGAKHD